MNSTNKIEFLEELTKGLGLNLVFVDDKARCSFVSWHLEKELGEAPASLEELVGTLADSPVKQTEFMAKFSTLKSGAGFSLEFDKTDINGNTRHFRIRSVAIPSLDAQTIAVQLEDTTNEHNLFKEIEILGRQASAGRVAAGVAHEFNNILTAMLGWTQLASKAAKDNEAASSALETIEVNTRRAKAIAGDMLDITRPRVGIDKLVSVNDAMEEALKLLSWDIQSAQITVDRDVEPTSLCKGASTRFVQVFINIIRNALDATPAHGKLRVSVKQTNGCVTASISDSGNGIPPNVIDRIFEPFFTTKIRGTENVQGGSGLGLSICKKIIEEFGGSIDITSRRPGGTTVNVKLPTSAENLTKSVDPPKLNSSFPPGIAVLVVDDEPDICEMIRTALSLRGAHVVVATNGTDALQMCKTEMFNAAFLDFSMNGLSGHELGNAIAEAQPDLPIVFMSGVEVPPNSNPVYSDFLKKPFDLHEIQVKLREILEKA